MADARMTTLAVEDLDIEELERRLELAQTTATAVGCWAHCDDCLMFCNCRLAGT